MDAEKFKRGHEIKPSPVEVPTSIPHFWILAAGQYGGRKVREVGNDVADDDAVGDVDDDDVGADDGDAVVGQCDESRWRNA